MIKINIMNNTAQNIVKQMMDADQFSQWLGIEVLEVREGYCKLKMTTRVNMCNGFQIVHGGITYSLADSALAFASNSHGRHAVSIDTSISHIKHLQPGELVIAIAAEKNVSRSIGIYEVRIEKENGELVALFKGTVFRKETVWHT